MRARKATGDLLEGNVTLDEQWQAIADKVTQDAAAVRCTPSEYRSGLRFIMYELDVALKASEETNPED